MINLDYMNAMTGYINEKSVEKPLISRTFDTLQSDLASI